MNTNIYNILYNFIFTMENKDIVEKNLKEYSDMKGCINVGELILGMDIIEKYFNYSGSGWSKFINLKNDKEFEDFMKPFLENNASKVIDELTDFFELNINNKFNDEFEKSLEQKK